MESATANPAPKSALKNWWDAYPAPVSSVGSLECGEVADLIRNAELGGKDFIVVDVRRNDHTVGGALPHVYPTLTGSIRGGMSAEVFNGQPKLFMTTCPNSMRNTRTQKR